MQEERVRRAGEQWEFHCDGCGHWEDRVWLVRGCLLCLACYTVSDGLDLFDRLKRACDLSEALQRQRQRRRRLARESGNGQRGPPWGQECECGGTTRGTTGATSAACGTVGHGWFTAGSCVRPATNRSPVWIGSRITSGSAIC